MTDTATSQINTALADLQTQLPRIAKDNTANVPTKSGGSYRYSYADLADISQAILPLMGKLGLSFISRPTVVEGGRFVLAYELRHISGEVVPGEYPLPNPDRGTPQEIGGAITYARRYCLCAVTGVAPDDDTDAQAAERAAQRRERRETRQPADRPAKDSPISGEQQRRMQDGFEAAGIAGKDARVKYASTVVERAIASATELTHVEAEKVIQRLGDDVRKAQAKPEETGAAGQGDPR